MKVAFSSLSVWWKWEKCLFLKTLLWPDFDLLESNSIYIFVHENQKNYHSTFFSLDACLSPMCSLCSISVPWNRECLAVTFRNCCKKLPFIDLNFKRYFLKIKFVCLLKGEACQKLSANWLIQPLACNFWFLKSWRENMVFTKYKPFKSSRHGKVEKYLVLSS